MVHKAGKHFSVLEESFIILQREDILSDIIHHHNFPFNDIP